MALNLMGECKTINPRGNYSQEFSIATTGKPEEIARLFPKWEGKMSKRETFQGARFVDGKLWRML